MLAFIIAAIVVIGTLGLAFLQVLAAGMSDVPGATSGAGMTLGIGFVIAGIIAATHFLPPIGW